MDDYLLHSLVAELRVAHSDRQHPGGDHREMDGHLLGVQLQHQWVNVQKVLLDLDHQADGHLTWVQEEFEHHLPLEHLQHQPQLLFSQLRAGIDNSYPKW